MMRRFTSFVMLILLLPCMLFARKLIETVPMDVEMAVDIVAEVTVENIAGVGDSTDNAFDLNSNLVNDMSQGLPIATWTIRSNYKPLSVKIEAFDLQATSGNNDTIPYLLNLESSYVENNGEVSGEFYIKSNGYNGQFSSQAVRNGLYTFTPNAALGVNFADNQIKFIIPDDVDITGKDNTTYSATVKFTIQEGGVN